MADILKHFVDVHGKIWVTWTTVIQAAHLDRLIRVKIIHRSITRLLEETHPLVRRQLLIIHSSAFASFIQTGIYTVLQRKNSDDFEKFRQICFIA